MSRRKSTSAAVIATIAIAILGATTVGARATDTAAICKTFTASKLKIQWSVIGNVSCGQAKPWLVKILADRGKPDAKLVVKNAPRGFKCSATADSKGRPSVGACYTGTPAFPKNGFQWFG